MLKIIQNQKQTLPVRTTFNEGGGGQRGLRATRTTELTGSSYAGFGPELRRVNRTQELKS